MNAPSPSHCGHARIMWSLSIVVCISRRAALPHVVPDSPLPAHQWGYWLAFRYALRKRSISSSTAPEDIGSNTTPTHKCGCSIRDPWLEGRVMLRLKPRAGRSDVRGRPQVIEILFEGRRNPFQAKLHLEANRSIILQLDVGEKLSLVSSQAG